MIKSILRTAAVGIVLCALMLLGSAIPTTVSAGDCCDCCWDDCCCDAGGTCTDPDWVESQLMRVEGPTWNAHYPDYATNPLYEPSRKVLNSLVNLGMDVYSRINLDPTDSISDYSIEHIVSVQSNPDNPDDVIKQCVPPGDPPSLPCLSPDWIGLIDPTKHRHTDNGLYYRCVREENGGSRRACIPDSISLGLTKCIKDGTYPACPLCP